MKINSNEISREHEKIRDYLIQKYGSILEKYKNIETNSKDIIQNNETIWMCWWQGVENAPEIVKRCINSVKKYAGNRPLVVITRDNYNNYIKLPNHILNKFEKGLISITHFSDILRINILSKYGGIWLDATCFITGDIFSDLLPEFYSVKLPHNDKEICVSDGKWCVFFMSGMANNVLFNFVKDFYNEYWKNENSILDYYLLDYIIDMAYNNINYVKKMIDSIPENNIKIHTLKEILNEPYNEKNYMELLKYNKIHKLAHERKYINELNNGQETFYGYIIKQQEMM